MSSDPSSPPKRARTDSEPAAASATAPITSNFEVYVSKDTFKFNAAHFVAFEGFRERLHGHNYRVGVRLLGHRTISQDGYLIDFGNIKECTRKICKRLNDHFLCPMYSNVMDIQEDVDKQQISLKCQDGSSFSFPTSDVAKLPIVHATAEELAIYLWVEILGMLDSGYLNNRGIHTMEVIVTEAPGQEATFRWPIEKQSETMSNGDSEKTKFTLDVRTFITERKLVPMPCIDEKKQEKKKDTCCPDCNKNMTTFSKQLEQLAQAMNEKGVRLSNKDKLSRQDLESMLS